ncbi:TetR family transcriptional regulator C-terminal domain-containing protein [Frigoriflavimonas asaccharolytica]|uniref:Tetracyclin repressor-like C-terminal domain-containing protein n=1 Tax=Frigoriflavimonas asaccharolytica TaxID=2735899 RepID=A0A8J8K7D3_9FLAO|nr:TetR family transcriptional regulator C-terminal domain-containing protein [Frigoriflavimonas asaccharolytica]NRS91878.1 hypothetical protein [Frigoriflavimonas asaccharolytica]
MEETNIKKIILESYSNFILENNHPPKNVFIFCNHIDLTEKEFYQYFANFEEIEKEYLIYFFEESKTLIIGDENYLQIEGNDKLLSLYYTFFEQLTLNRSLVLYLFNKHKSPLKQFVLFSKLKSSFLHFVEGLNLQSFDMNATMQDVEKLAKLQKKGVEEIFWGNFAATFKFWMEDKSPSFEKTDLFIEKSIAASLELTEAEPFKKLVDFGKFILKEQITKYKACKP